MARFLRGHVSECFRALPTGGGAAMVGAIGGGRSQITYSGLDGVHGLSRPAVAMDLPHPFASNFRLLLPQVLPLTPDCKGRFS